MKTAADNRTTVNGSFESIARFKTLLQKVNSTVAATSPHHHKVPFSRLWTKDAPNSIATAGRCRGAGGADGDDGGRCVSLYYRTLLITASNISFQRNVSLVCSIVLWRYRKTLLIIFFLLAGCVSLAHQEMPLSKMWMWIDETVAYFIDRWTYIGPRIAYKTFFVRFVRDYYLYITLPQRARKIEGAKCEMTSTLCVRVWLPFCYPLFIFLAHQQL